MITYKEAETILNHLFNASIGADLTVETLEKDYQAKLKQAELVKKNAVASAEKSWREACERFDESMSVSHREINRHASQLREWDRQIENAFPEIYKSSKAVCGKIRMSISGIGDARNQEMQLYNSARNIFDRIKNKRTSLTGKVLSYFEMKSKPDDDFIHFFHCLDGIMQISNYLGRADINEQARRNSPTLQKEERKLKERKAAAEQLFRQKIEAVKNCRPEMERQTIDEIRIMFESYCSEKKINEINREEKERIKNHNTVTEPEPGTTVIIDNFNVVAPIREFQYNLAREAFREYYAAIIDNNLITIPVRQTTKGMTALFIDSGKSETALLDSIVFSWIAGCPAGELHISAITPVRGKEALKSFDSMIEKYPEMFDMYVSGNQNEISGLIQSLKNKISEPKQSTELLVIYDYPKGFQKDSLEALQFIIKNGPANGINTVIHSSQCFDDYEMKQCSEKLEAIRSSCHVISHIGNKERLQIKVDNSRPLLFQFMPMLKEKAFKAFYDSYASTVFMSRYGDRSYLKDLHRLNECSVSDQYAVLQSIIHGNYDLSHKVLPLGMMRVPPYMIKKSGQEKEQILDTLGIPDLDGQKKIYLPFLAELDEGLNLLLYGQKQDVCNTSHSIVWRILHKIPADQVAFTVIDPAGRGASFGPFMEMTKQLDLLFDGGIYSDGESIKNRLKELDLECTDRIQLLSGQYNSIFEYNENSRRNKKPLRILVIYDYPHGLDRSSIEMLKQILRNGTKAGIYSLICTDSDGAKEIQNIITETGFWTELLCDEYGFCPDGSDILIKKDSLPLPGKDEISKYTRTLEENIAQYRGAVVTFEEILRKENERYREDIGGTLSIPVGVDDQEKPVSLKIGSEGGLHGLIIGESGWGKSVLLHTIIMSGIMHYTPKQLEIYLLDFKDGVEFNCYKSHPVPHIKGIVLKGRQELGRNILQDLLNIMVERNNLFKSEGVETIEQYNKKARNQRTDLLPEILVLIDEFQQLFNDKNRNLSEQIRECAKEIVSQGRSSGVHLLMATQNTSPIFSLNLKEFTDDMSIRIALSHDDRTLSYLFATEEFSGYRNKAKAASILKGAKKGEGTAAYVLGKGDEPEALTVAFETSDERSERLDRVAERFGDMKNKPFIFEGGVQTPLEDYLEWRKSCQDQNALYIPVGQQMKLTEPFVDIGLTDTQSCNVLIFGNNNASMESDFINSILYTACHNPETYIYCTDALEIKSSKPNNDLYDYFAGEGKFNFITERRKLLWFIEELYDIYERRRYEEPDRRTYICLLRNIEKSKDLLALFVGESIDESPYQKSCEQEEDLITANAADTNEMDPSEKALQFLINAKNVSSQEQKTRSNRSGEKSITEKLHELIENGYEVNIHIIVTVQDMQPLLNQLQKMDWISRRDKIINSFPNRIFYSLRQQDKEFFLKNDDTVNYEEIETDMALFIDAYNKACPVRPLLMQIED